MDDLTSGGPKKGRRDRCYHYRLSFGYKMQEKVEVRTKY